MQGKSAGTTRSRRQLLVSGAKALPALAVIGLAIATPARAEDADCGACSSSCSGSCYQGCTGSCQEGCTGSCMTGCEGGTK